MTIPDHVTIADLEAASAAILPSNTFEFYDSGARDERTVAANLAGWASWRFVPRVLADISGVSLATSVLGAPVELPILVAPMSVQRMAHPKGELAVARATAAAGTINVVSQGTMVPIEEIAAVPGGRFWAQHYAIDDPGADAAIIADAVSAGATAIVLTVDAPLRVGTRARPRGGFAWPGADQMGIPLAMRHPQRVNLTWGYVDRLAASAGVPLVLKGIVHPDDARIATEHGVAAIVVSNHGGRILDGAVSTAEMLPEIAEAIGGALELYVDGGIRRGGDVLRALALGARAALVGRPVLWGLAYAGEDGVAHVLGALRRELGEDAAAAGVADVRTVPRGLVRRSGVCASCGGALE